MVGINAGAGAINTGVPGVAIAVTSTPFTTRTKVDPNLRILPADKNTLGVPDAATPLIVLITRLIVPACAAVAPSVVNTYSSGSVPHAGSGA